MLRVWDTKGPGGSSAGIPIRNGKPGRSTAFNTLPTDTQHRNVANNSKIGNSQASVVAQHKTVHAPHPGSATRQHQEHSLNDVPKGSGRNITRMTTDKILGFEAYSVGTIFCALTHQPHYNQDFQDGVDANDGYISILGPPGAAVVYSKYRKFVVVARFAHHCIVLPVFTNGGKGLNNKEDGFDLNEFVSIRDYRSKQTAAKTETPRYGTLWSTQHRGFDRVGFTGPMTDFTAVHISSPYSYNYQWPSTKVGELIQDSKDLMRRLFTDSMLGATGGDKVKPKDVKDDDGFQVAASRKSNFTSNRSLYKHPASLRAGPTPRSIIPNYN